jgi:ferrous iron transport protein A
MVRRLLEMGILEGSRVEVVHEAPFGRDPLAIRVRGALIALRRHEAAHIEVEVP